MAIRSTPQITTLTASAVAILTAPVNSAITISKALICNTNAAFSRTVNVWHDVTGAAGAATATQILKSYAISPGETKTLPISSVFLANGSKLYMSADVTSEVNVSLNYTITEQAP